ncbi:MAG: LytTR family transcriptional regulator DNA-binding domain-containing protein [Chitinophagaceae bacterium]|nr:LytTR family transcriptional regulator DNA-binding domain-containing protein [Chitinophagaceae bacterium]MBL0304832.1 LytTR family transcriptional regulator DNA-binding domain-containing protein [Chitinophagaceae bacterium]HQV59745.1 LytTR family transcriptional regulator DNA-binding domain-containing protein [Chitinophagaceae bacterium]HQV85859.1 LytTR family transcriptional regulator DNA-binding domain-containing protein [Chitinophagaceae bacterium]HQX73794.1 LytTR family transcriptional r
MKAIIIDDERLARLELRKLLQEFPEIEVIDEAVNADEAISKIEATQPDLIFLDIQMPGKTGFDMLAELDKSPHVIFTTAHHEFALKAFEVNALDYLMKPVEPKRLADAIQKLQISENKEIRTDTEFTNNSILSENDQVFVKDGERCWFVKLSDIRLFESVGNYAKVFFANNKPLILKSLNALEERLDEKIFFRANRKHIVNLRMIEKIEPYFNGGLLLDMKGGEKIEVSRRQTVKFKEMMSL